MSAQTDDEPTRLIDSPTLQKALEQAFGDEAEEAEQ